MALSHKYFLSYPDSHLKQRVIDINLTLIYNNNMNTQISVIIPFHNCEDTLPLLLGSILRGTIIPFEILLIDDGSDDSSCSIAREYAAGHSCIKVLSQSHSGVSVARNLGLSAANGHWISFLDADDYIEPDMYSTMLDQLRKSCENTDEIDGCICGYYTHKDGVITPYIPDYSEVLSSKELLKSMFTDEAVKGFLFTRLFKADLLKDISFNKDISICEDQLFQTQLFSTKNVRFTAVCKPLYHYVQTPASATSTKSFFINNTFIYKPAYEMISKYISEDYVMTSYNSILDYSMYTLLKSYQQNKDAKTLRQIRLMQKEMKRCAASSIPRSKRRLAYEFAPILYSHVLK